LPLLLYGSETHGRAVHVNVHERGGDQINSMTASQADSSNATGFDCFRFDPRLVRGIREAGFAEPRPIQAEAMPAALAGRDVLGLAETGTGKTAAFALPLLERLLGGERRGAPRALVIAPTRELATQIDAEIRSLARFTRLTSVTIFGGASARAQIAALRRRPDVIVACPGRLLDLMNQGAVRLAEVETLVLDEADHMFDMGFLPDIRRILAALPRRRQNLLFSATMPGEIRRLADEILSDAHVVELGRSAPAATIEHALVPVSEARKRELLDHLLGEPDCESAIVFTRTKHRARRLAEQLGRAGRSAVGLQGNMSQGQRDRAMRGFREGRYEILVATDIAARGIDVSGVSHVINFDVPTTPEAYTHRLGRTGRAERQGRASTFVTSADAAWVRATERMLGTAIRRRAVPGFESEAERSERTGRSRAAGNRPGPRSGRGRARSRRRRGA
jgi:ATP-dependent RNA helicase RhlE